MHIARGRRSRRASTLKLKINGVCVNSCSFCPYHEDPSRLEVRDLERLVDNLRVFPAHTVVVNGGEPTLHPGFFDICEWLGTRLGQRCRLVLGSNLIPLGRGGDRARRLLETVRRTFDEVEVGCDDEHHVLLHDPPPFYRFCACCPEYRPAPSIGGHLLSAAGRTVALLRPSSRGTS